MEKMYGDPIDKNAMQEVRRGIGDTLASLGLDDSVVSSISIDDTMSWGGLAAYERNRPQEIYLAKTNGRGEITINGAFLRSPGDFNRIMSNPNRVSGVSNTFYGTVAHETAHAVVAYLARNGTKAGLFDFSVYRDGKIEQQIIAKADKAFKGRATAVSDYAKESPSENVAECVADVIEHRGNANPYSIYVFNELKKQIAKVKKGGS